MTDRSSNQSAVEHAAEPLVTLKNISKSFGPVKVIKDVTVSVYPGKVQVLLGENGAGKSTLIKIMAGVYQPDGGHALLAIQVVETSGAPTLGGTWIGKTPLNPYVLQDGAPPAGPTRPTQRATRSPTSFQSSPAPSLTSNPPKWTASPSLHLISPSITIFSHSVMAGSSSIARTRLRRLLGVGEAAVGMVHLTAAGNLPQSVCIPYRGAWCGAEDYRM